MSDSDPARRYRFGAFEADASTGELRRQGIRIKLHAQPFQVLLMLLERPGEVLSREEISRALWSDDTFVDYDHGVNSAVNRIREALGDAASSPVSWRHWLAADTALSLPSKPSPPRPISLLRRNQPALRNRFRKQKPGPGTGFLRLSKSCLRLRPPWCRRFFFCSS